MQLPGDTSQTAGDDIPLGSPPSELETIDEDIPLGPMPRTGGLHVNALMILGGLVLIAISWGLNRRMARHK